VIDNDIGRKRGEKVPELREVLRFEVHDHVPAQRGNPMGDVEQHLARREIHEPLAKV